MEELAARFEATQEQARRNESGHVAIDLVLASMGNTISESLDGAERAARRGAGVGGDGDEDTGAPAAAALRALRRATSDIDTFEAEVVRQQKDVEYALALRAKARDALKDCNEQYVMPLLLPATHTHTKRAVGPDQLRRQAAAGAFSLSPPFASVLSSSRFKHPHSPHISPQQVQAFG